VERKPGVGVTRNVPGTFPQRFEDNDDIVCRRLNFLECQISRKIEFIREAFVYPLNIRRRGRVSRVQPERNEIDGSERKGGGKRKRWRGYAGWLRFRLTLDISKTGPCPRCLVWSMYFSLQRDLFAGSCRLFSCRTVESAMAISCLQRSLRVTAEFTVRLYSYSCGSRTGNFRSEFWT